MKKILLLYILAFAAYAGTTAQIKALEKKWSYNTAIVMPAGKWESGLFQPFRLGIGDRFEVRTNALVLPLLPNAGVKISLGSAGTIDLASEHQVSWPSPFLNFISRKGTGGLISPEFEFPFILSIGNSIFGTAPVGRKMLFSASLGYVFALRGSKPDPLSTIDIPLFYPRMAHYYSGTTVRPGISLKAQLSEKWFLEQSLQAFVVTRSDNNLFAENNGTVMWAPGRSLRIRGGYVLTYGKFPFGKYWQMWPTFDLVFGSR